MNVGALSVVAAGVAAALHAGKLPPAMPLLREQLGMSLVQVSLMVSLFQVFGMCLGIVGGMFADRFGARRVMTSGLVVLGLSSLAATASDGPAALLASRLFEGVGFVLTVLPAAVLLRRQVAPAGLAQWLGMWGAYMPTGMAIALLAGPWLLSVSGWRGLWTAVGVATLLVAVLVRARTAPDDRDARGRADMRALIVGTLRVPGPWVLALGFGCYAAQWMSVFSFLPSIYQAGGIAPGLAGLLTALAVAVNLSGNIASGWLVSRRLPPPWLLAGAGATMALSAWVAFGSGAPFGVQYGAVLALSMVGGIIPGTSFVLAPRMAPDPDAVSTTVGLMQQGSMLGQFVAPPVLAMIASGPQGWSAVWQATALFAAGNVVGGVLMWRLMRRARPGGFRSSGSAGSC
jgi:CP family cyanate transporter-like MFS transporter